MVIEIIQNYPRISIISISGVMSLFISLINHFVLDKEKVKKGKAKQKELQKQIKEHKHNPTKAMELQKEMLAHGMENMKHSLKPMIITIIPILIVFGQIRKIFADTLISESWLWYYIGGTFAFSIFFRKIFKLP